MINFKTVIRIIGILLLLETVMLLLCSGVSFYYQDEALVDFWVSAGITAGAGLLLAAMGKGGDRQLTRRDGYVLVRFAWVASSLFGMLPFYISGYIPSITNAFFETMSGFSSTGATILDDIEALPHGLLFWRSMTQWIGGLGIIMFTIAILPIFGVSGLQVFAAEASGPTHDKVHPRIGITAKWIWSIYAGITCILVALLMLGGMDWFDSVCHAFATTGTGGFSTKQASVAHYKSRETAYGSPDLAVSLLRNGQEIHLFQQPVDVICQSGVVSTRRLCKVRLHTEIGSRQHFIVQLIRTCMLPVHRHGEAGLEHQLVVLARIVLRRCTLYVNLNARRSEALLRILQVRIDHLDRLLILLVLWQVADDVHNGQLLIEFVKVNVAVSIVYLVALIQCQLFIHIVHVGNVVIE